MICQRSCQKFMTNHWRNAKRKFERWFFVVVIHFTSPLLISTKGPVIYCILHVWPYLQQKPWKIFQQPATFPLLRPTHRDINAFDVWTTFYGLAIKIKKQIHLKKNEAPQWSHHKDILANLEVLIVDATPFHNCNVACMFSFCLGGCVRDGGWCKVLTAQCN